METVPISSDAFLRIYECILECVEDEFGKLRKKLTAADLKRINVIHGILNNRGLRLSRIG
ncbi:unnamed protein product [Gongylonema pulchrum]|uniref:MarR family transcriptional regulator n=1 Tax=Gongylonema pulchrum TaxID=637853 RepID=A0A183DFR1_9BILA|nr:unnamed protein product [Gongylonema pulchrum]